MNEKFRNVPIEEDTKVLFRAEATLGAYEALHEKWLFEAVKAESLILADQDVQGVSNEDLERELRASQFIRPGSQVTISRGKSGYTFLNFNFDVR